MQLEQFIELAPNPNKTAVTILFNLLKVSYAEPHRHYHTLSHLEFGLQQQEQLLPDKPLRVEEFFAWAYHDVVYDPTIADNEFRSAHKFMNEYVTLGLTADQADTALGLILSTMHTGRTNLITDMDLSILGQAPQIYGQYSKDIRKEYSFVPRKVWQEGRTNVLTEFLNRSHLYFTNEFAKEFTTPARENLRFEIALLSIR